ncbi:hypothetical protein AB8U03_09515 [Clostridium sp. Mt-5]|uniref:Uncharacterized protein n=1 Tax=Clostridium moutaii TaxID=3240932 RepID=A0ABV4BQC9_9CLOT
MLGVNWIELFLRGIPEMLLMIWGIHMIAKKPFNAKKCIPLSIIMSIIVFFLRELPIYFGVHTLIMLILIISIMVLIGIPIITSIYGTLFMLLILSLSEFLNMLILKLLAININLNSIAPIKKSLLGIPSLIIMLLILMIMKYLLNKRRTKNALN